MNRFGSRFLDTVVVFPNQSVRLWGQTVLNLTFFVSEAASKKRPPPQKRVIVLFLEVVESKRGFLGIENITANVPNGT